MSEGAIHDRRTPIKFFRLQEVLESLKAKGFDKPTVKYASKFYGITLEFEIKPANQAIKEYVS